MPSIAPPENPSNAHHVLQTTGETCSPQKRYLLRHWCLESSRVDPVQGVWLHRVLEAGVARGLLDDRRVLANRLRGAGDGRLRGWTHIVIQCFVQLLVGVGSTFCIRVFIVGGVTAVGAVHGILTTWRRQVGQTVIVDVKVILSCPISLVDKRKVKVREALFYFVYV